MIVTLLDPVGIPLAFKDFIQEPDIQIQIIGMSDVLKADLEQFFARIPDNLTHTAIDVQPLALRSDMGNADAGMFKRVTEHRLALGQSDRRVLRFLGLGSRHAWR